MGRQVGLPLLIQSSIIDLMIGGLIVGFICFLINLNSWLAFRVTERKAFTQNRRAFPLPPCLDKGLLVSVI